MKPQPTSQKIGGFKKKNRKKVLFPSQSPGSVYSVEVTNWIGGWVKAIWMNSRALCLPGSLNWGRGRQKTGDWNGHIYWTHISSAPTERVKTRSFKFHYKEIPLRGRGRLCYPSIARLLTYLSPSLVPSLNYKLRFRGFLSHLIVPNAFPPPFYCEPR